jgi:hypothetical protein
MRARCSIIIFLIVFSLALAPLKGVSRAADPLETHSTSASAMLVDFLVVRPLGVLSFALGTGLFVVSLPITIAAGEVDNTYETLMLKPARMTFIRPLGENLRTDQH